MVAGQLELLMLANLARLQKDMTQGKAMVTSAVGSINKVLGTIGVGISFGAVVSGFNNVVDSLAKLDDQAEKTGASVEELSVFQQVARIGGHSADVYEGALTRLSKSLHSVDEETKSAGKALAALGLKQDELKGKDTAVALRIVAGELNKFEDGVGKTALAMDLLGKSGAQALPFLKDLATEGGINARVTAEQAAKAEEFQKALGRLKNEMLGAAQALTLDLLPGMTKWIQANLEGVRIAGSFGQMLKLFVFNKEAMTTEKPIEQIKRLTSEIDDLNTKMARFIEQGRSGWQQSIQSQIDNKTKQLQFVKFLHTQDTGGIVDFVGDTGMPDPSKKPKLDYASDTTKGPKDKALQDYLKTSAQILEGEEQLAKDVAEAWKFVPAMEERLKERERWENMFEGTDTAINKTNAELEVFHSNVIKGAEFLQDYDVQQGQIAAGFDGMGNAIEKNKGMWDDFALTGTSALEDLIFNLDRSVKAIDYLKAAAMDFFKVWFRHNVSKPFMEFGAKALAGAFSGGGAGSDQAPSLFDGQRAGGGPVSGGRSYLVGERGPELFVPGSSGSVVPSHALGAGGVTVIQHLHFSANTPAAARDAVMAAAPMLISQAKVAVRDERDRKADRR